MKHLTTVDDLNSATLDKLFTLTDDIKKNGKAYANVLKGRVIATMFFEPSTRTRLSFESAILRLGAGLISTENARLNASATKGESLPDTIKIVQGYSDAIVIRHYEDDSAEVARKVSGVPIINAGSGGSEHPTQALLDVYTIKEAKGHLNNISVALLGDLKYGRTTHSLLKLMSLFEGLTVYGLPVAGLGLPPDYIEILKSRGAKYIEVQHLADLPPDIDIIYQTRVQKERLQGENLEGIELVALTKENFARFSAQTYLLHPLPRVDELDAALDADPRAIYFKQAINGMYIRMALLVLLCKKG